MVNPIPDGFHSVTPHLVVSPCGEAIDFYKKAFSAEELMRMPGPENMVMHCELKIGNSILMLADEMEGMGMKCARNVDATTVTLHMYVQDADVAFQKAVDAGCTVEMSVTDMPWGDRYGKLKDPYGNCWSVATHTKDMTPEEITAAMAQMGEQREGQE